MPERWIIFLMQWNGKIWTGGHRRSKSSFLHGCWRRVNRHRKCGRRDGIPWMCGLIAVRRGLCLAKWVSAGIRRPEESLTRTCVLRVLINIGVGSKASYWRPLLRLDRRTVSVHMARYLLMVWYWTRKEGRWASHWEISSAPWRSYSRYAFRRSCCISNSFFFFFGLGRWRSKTVGSNSRVLERYVHWFDCSHPSCPISEEAQEHGEVLSWKFRQCCSCSKDGKSAQKRNGIGVFSYFFSDLWPTPLARLSDMSWMNSTT